MICDVRCIISLTSMTQVSIFFAVSKSHGPGSIGLNKALVVAMIPCQVLPHKLARASPSGKAGAHVSPNVLHEGTAAVK